MSRGHIKLYLFVFYQMCIRDSRLQRVDNAHINFVGEEKSDVRQQEKEHEEFKRSEQKKRTLKRR